MSKAMNLKLFGLSLGLALACCMTQVQVQEVKANNNQQSKLPVSSLRTTENLQASLKSIGDGLSVSTSNNNLLLLIPSNINITGDFNDANGNLFKLNTDALLNQADQDKMATTDDLLFEEQAEGRSLENKNGARESRRINFLKGIWNKPKMSPLYLVNGTVCRFINSLPICTTLTTTGLIPTSNIQSQTNTANQEQGNNGQNVRIQGGMQFPANQQMQQFPNNQQQQLFNNNQQFNPRPSPVSEDESQDINVESSNNSVVEGNLTAQVSGSTNRPMTSAPIVQGNMRPVNVANRKPLNLLTLRRPMRKFQQG